MFCYLWYEKTNPKECKFGERWVFDGQDPVKEIWKRIRSSVGVRNDLIKDGTIVLQSYWDVTDYAKKVNRYYQRSRVDDHIRPHIGYRKGSTGEIHELPASEVEIKVNKLLAKMGQPLPVAGLSAWQANTAENVLNSISNGCKTIAAELCARFGKTIWSGVLARETNSSLTIVASYVLTSFASFEKDLTSFDQFKDMVIIDSADPEYRDVIDNAIANNKQVIVFLSMCAGTKRESKIKYLFGLNCDRLVIIDEADFGVHKAGQSKPLINARKNNDTVILMTGTNADKAVSFWPVDHMVTVVYPELIMEKKQPRLSYTTNLNHFEINTQRHDMVVDIEFYQMDLKNAVEFARQTDPTLFIEDGIYLPSWSKTAANPVKAKGFITRMLQAVFEGKHGWDELNVDYQTGRRPKDGQRVSMMFVPGSTTNSNLEDIVGIATEALKGYRIVAVYGGDDMTNRSAENIVKEEIEKAAKENQHVLLISAGMAQRSFSVGAITELYLAYDTGDNGATIQKISRALTPDQVGKVGRIVSLSFDPNRDDKFDALLIETALNYKHTNAIKSAKDALRDVLRTVDIFRCSEDGRIKLEADHYLEQAIARNSVSRVVGKVADITRLSHAQVRALANGDANVFTADKEEAAQKGKTRHSESKSSNSKDDSDEKVTAVLIAKARKMITTIVENMDIIILGTGSKTLNEAFDTVSNDATMCKDVKKEFNVDFTLIKELFSRKVINTELVELLMDH